MNTDLFHYDKTIYALRKGLTFTLVGILLLLSTFSFANSNAVAWNNDDTQWKTLHSKHFEVIYKVGQEKLSTRAISIGEKALVKLSDFFQWEPKDPIRMVMVDDFDVSNGWATALPFNQIRLFISPPDTLNSLENYDDWFKLLITHELTHILHMDLSRNAPNKLRSIFGRYTLFFPHALTPSFLLEGLAVYTETDFEEGIGRGQSSYYNMMMRAEAHNGLLSLNDIISQRKDWPANTQYLYGYFFYQYLADTYGDEKIRAYVQEYAKNIIPFFLVNSSAHKVFGKDFHQMWPDFQTWITTKFESDNKQQYTSSNGISNNGYALEINAQNNNHYYYIKNNGHDAHQLVRVNNNGGKTELFKTKGINDLDVNEDGNILATRLIHTASGHLWSDIFSYDQKGNETRLTYNQRYRNVRWLSNSNMLAKRIINGVSMLDILDSKGDFVYNLWTGSNDDVIGGFDVNNEGVVVASIKQKKSTWQLAILNHKATSTKNHSSQPTWNVLTHTKAIENNPQIIGNTIYYSADYNGRYNIFQLDIDNQTQVTQLTNAAQGAFTPKVIGEKLYFQNYSHLGYDHSIMNLTALSSNPISSLTEQKTFQANIADDAEHELPDTKVTDYNPLPTLAPHYWLPQYQSNDTFTSLGFQTSGLDALGRHEYSLIAAYDIDFDVIAGAAIYQYDNKYVLSYNQQNTYYSHLGNDDRIKQTQSAAIIRTNIFNAIEDQLALHAGFVQQRDVDITSSKLTKYASSIDESLVGIALTFNNTEQYQSSISPSWGRNIKLVVETNEVIDSSYSGNIIRADWRDFFDLPGDHVLGLRVAGAYGDQLPNPFTLGRVFSSAQEPLFGMHSYSLRGYKTDVQIGNRLQLNSLEYRFPLLRIDKNWGFIPLGLGDISANIFVDSGAAWSDIKGHTNIDYLTGTGFEISTDISIFYRTRLPVRLGYAKGFDEKLGDDVFYVNIGQSF
jgi:hypothetical protein